MDVFVAGASGAIGRKLIPQLVANGHRVVGMVRSQAKRELVEGLGAEAAIADALDAEAVGAAVAEARPEVVVNELTALGGGIDFRHVERAFAATNRLRTEGNENLLAAARAAGARRFLAQSFAGWPFARRGGPVKSEQDPLDPEPIAAMRTTLAAIRQLETAVSGAEGIEGLVLRYGGLYGPGTSVQLNPDGEQVAEVRKRRFPVVGDGAGVWSFLHVEDAALATAAAVERGPAGLYNVVDDDPAPASEWLPALAAAIGAKPPRRVPRWLARLAAGEAAVMILTEARGAANAKAKRELGWQPRYASWREGFRTGLSAS